MNQCQMVVDNDVDFHRSTLEKTMALMGLARLFPNTSTDGDMNVYLYAS